MQIHTYHKYNNCLIWFYHLYYQLVAFLELAQELIIKLAKKTQHPTNVRSIFYLVKPHRKYLPLRLNTSS